MNRRAFLRHAAFTALSGALGGCASFGSSPRGLTVAGIRIGVQMWSVNDLWKKDPAAAFRRLKAMGYDGVQSFAFLAMDWNELARMLDGEGLRIVDMPFFMKNTQGGEFDRFVDFCHRFEIDFAFEPYAKCATGALWHRHAGELAALRGKFAAQGIRIGYHNHQHELREEYAGERPLEILYGAGLDFELDVGHVKLAGDCPERWLGRLHGRVPSIHAKPGGGRAIGGAGDRNDWRAIFAEARRAGTSWAIVECETRRNTFDDVAASAAFLRTLG